MGHMSDTTSITHGIYNIDHDVNYRQVSESAVQWFFTKFDLHDPSYLITLNLTKYDNLKCWGESFQVDDSTDGGKDTCSDLLANGAVEIKASKKDKPTMAWKINDIREWLSDNDVDDHFSYNKNYKKMPIYMTV